MSSSDTAPKKSKIVSHGRALQEVYDISFAVNVDEYRNNIQKLLDTLSDLSVAKAYYSTFLVGHHSCSCSRCKLQQNFGQKRRPRNFSLQRNLLRKSFSRSGRNLSVFRSLF